MTRKGLPGQLKDEVEKALRPIFLKHLDMRKKHMSRDRIVGGMYGAFQTAVRQKDGD